MDETRSLAPEGRRFLALIDGGPPTVKELPTLAPLLQLEAPPSWVGDWSPDGERVVTASPAGLVEVWDPMSGENLLAWRLHPEAGGITGLEMSPDGWRLAV